MIVRRLDDLIGTDREVDDGNWVSRRFILRDDGMGFSMHDTVVRAGTETEMWYKHHLEAVYCIAGEGEVETVDDGRVYPLRPGTLYALDGHERHKLRAQSDLHLVCAFCPPCTGREVHDAEGAYPLVESHP